MKKKFSLVMALAITFAITLAVFPVGSALAQIADGTYDVNYEMKEASSESTSIADGFFSKPATLTVEDGEKHIELTVTSSDMIQSLSTPTGEVDIVDENEEENTRTIKFRVDQDLSEPLEMEMHVIVPDLYDMKHTARAVFEVDQFDAADGEANEEDNSKEVNEEPENNNEDEEKTHETSDENQEDSEADNSTSNALWITLAIVGVIIIAGIVFWIVRKKGNK